MNYLITFIIAVVWGYFSDLRKGQVNWFMARLVFMMMLTYILDTIRN